MKQRRWVVVAFSCLWMCAALAEETAIQTCQSTTQTPQTGTRCVTRANVVFVRADDGWKDTLSGLTWMDQKDADNQKGAEENCAKVSNHRLPSKADFETAELHGLRDVIWDMRPEVLGNKYHYYWSSSSVPGSSDKKYLFNARMGYSSDFESQDLSFPVISGRCVAAGKPVSRCGEVSQESPIGTVCLSTKNFYFERVKGAWKDRVTNLAWSDAQTGKRLTNPGAEKYCSDQIQSLPSQDQFIEAEDHGYREIVRNVPDSKSKGNFPYWTSTGAGGGMHVFIIGNAGYPNNWNSDSHELYARCVTQYVSPYVRP